MLLVQQQQLYFLLYTTKTIFKKYINLLITIYIRKWDTQNNYKA